MPRAADARAFRRLLADTLRQARIRAAGACPERLWRVVRRTMATRVHELCARVWLREQGDGQAISGGGSLGSAPGAEGGSRSPSTSFAPWAPLLPELAATFAGQIADQTEALIEAGRQLGPSGGAPGIIGLQGPCSDFHSGGTCVWRCAMAGLGTWFYKPRPVEIDVAFARLVEHLRERHAAPLAPPPPLVPLRDSGWQEAARASTPRSRRQAIRACLGLGWMLALLHALRATDIHPENVVLGVEGPVLVDAETVLHPNGPDCTLEYVGQNVRLRWNDSLQRLNAFSARLADDTTGRSARLGWFEARDCLGLVSRPRLRIDASGGLTADPGWKWVPNPHVRFWRAVRRLRPEWREDVWRGFVDGWSALGADADGFHAAVQLCQAAPRRVIWRDTAAFYQILERSLSRSALGSWEERRTFFARSSGLPSAMALTEREVDDLVRGDIPRLLQTEPVGPADLTLPAASFRDEFTLGLREDGSEVRIVY